jgi:arginine-tRNA-protein transferase
MELPQIEWLPGIPIPLLRGEQHACSYLPDRRASELYALASRIDGRQYQALMDQGFRRSADVFYRPSCPDCRACRPIRVPVESFIPSRSQRRVSRRNQDVRIVMGPPASDDEHWALFQRYQQAKHNGEMLDSRATFESFLCRSPIETFEMSYRVDGRLIGVGIVDLTPDTLSSMYFYFDLDESARSPGVFSALAEIAECRRRAKPWWYLGFHVAGCAKMDYKTRFRPCELLGTDERWTRYGAPAV